MVPWTSSVITWLTHMVRFRAACTPTKMICAMSTLFAATYPERVSRLILFGGYVTRRDLNIAEVLECHAETCRSKLGSGPGRSCPVCQVRTACGQSGSGQSL